MNDIVSPSKALLRPATPVVSVVIIGRNEGVRLFACLRSVMAAHWSVPMEMIYVDSGSSDGSVVQARARSARTCSIAPPYSAAAARNAGLDLARGKFVLFLDGDTVLDANFPGQALQALSHAGKHTACVWGHRRESDACQSLYTRALDLDWVFPIGETEFCGGDALFRREALEQVGGFDAGLIAGEEPELCRRLRALGWRVLHIDAPMTSHDLGIRYFSQYWKRCERAGHAYASIARRFAGSADPLWHAESRRNVWHALVLTALLLLPAFNALLTALFANPADAGLAALASAVGSVGVLAALVLRSAQRHAWKADSANLALLYGLHSHLQQFPVLAGQLGFWLRKQRRSPRALMEYR
jgi:cellulose synthase/poly-beta-1,6-N-acetylglucosamine synthase-like glycosyltransferase